MSARPELVAKVAGAIKRAATTGDYWAPAYESMAEAAIAAVAQFIQEDK